MNDSIEDRVYALVAEERAVKREELTPTSTLSHDLGMEGDDAVEFFGRFAKEFSVDTRKLGKDWHAYFSPEGAGLGTLLCVFVPPGVFAAVLSLVFPSLPLWLWGIMGIVGWFAAIYYWQKTHPSPQISVQDLVECAQAGIWKKELPGSIRIRLSKYRRYGLIRWLIS